MKNVVIKMVIGLSLCVALTGTCSAEGMAYREERASILRQTDCQAPSKAIVHDVWLEAAPLSGLITTVNVEPGEYVRVVLVGSAGTGYEWKSTESKTSFLETVKIQVLPFPQSQQLAGGKVASIFLYKAPETAQGDDRLNYAYYRAWEGEQKGVSFVEVNVHYINQ